MAATINWYLNGALNLANGNIDLNTDTFKIMLVNTGYTVDLDTHNFRDDITNEASGTGYTAGGATLASVTCTADTGSDQVRFDAADVSWPTSTITAYYGVIYKSRGGASSADELLCYIDFGGVQTTTAQTFAITWNANGILYIDTT